MSKITEAWCAICKAATRKGKCKKCGEVNPPCSGCRVVPCNWDDRTGCVRMQKGRKA